MHVLQEIWRGLDWSVLTDLLLSIIPALVCITLHELAHGYVACRLGDDTAKRAGRLTLNPLKHIVLWPCHDGYIQVRLAKPVPVNMWKFKNPKKGMGHLRRSGACGKRFDSHNMPVHLRDIAQNGTDNRESRQLCR